MSLSWISPLCILKLRIVDETLTRMTDLAMKQQMRLSLTLKHLCGLRITPKKNKTMVSNHKIRLSIWLKYKQSSCSTQHQIVLLETSIFGSFKFKNKASLQGRVLRRNKSPEEAVHKTLSWMTPRSANSICARPQYSRRSLFLTFLNTASLIKHLLSHYLFESLWLIS